MDKLSDIFIPRDDRDAESVLTLVGDISSKIDQLAQFIKYIEDRFIRVIFLPGNHEYYNHNISTWAINCRSEFDKVGIDNVATGYSNVGITVIDDVRFIHGTLWGECSHDPVVSMLLKRSIADFHVIGVKDRVLTVADMMLYAQEDKQDIFRALNQDHAGDTFVLTHHLPSYQCVDQMFVNSMINGAFVNDCMRHMVPEIAPRAWIHGHTHATIDKNIGYDRGMLPIVCNPAGYRSEWNQPFNTFSPKFIDLSAR
jgi:hypothetical protein